MKLKEILARITGLSTPVGGVSWQAPEPQVAAARRVLTFLEDCRVLYNPCALEVPEQCVESVCRIRNMLTSEIGKLPDDNVLTQSLRAMRAACRKFLDGLDHDTHDIVGHALHHGHYASWVFFAALGELRGVFGVHVARIATHHKLDVEDGLASVLPGADDLSGTD